MTSAIPILASSPAPPATSAASSWPSCCAAAGASVRSRHEVAEPLRGRVPEVVYVRAAMVIGQGSASFDMLRHLVTPARDHHPALGRHPLAARILDRRPPAIVRAPVLSPRLSSDWVSLVTPVEAGLVRPLVDGRRSEMVVEQPPPAGINDAPMGFEDAVRAAL